MDHASPRALLDTILAPGFSALRPVGGADPGQHPVEGPRRLAERDRRRRGAARPPGAGRRPGQRGGRRAATARRRRARRGAAGRPDDDPVPGVTMTNRRDPREARTARPYTSGAFDSPALAIAAREVLVGVGLSREGQPRGVKRQRLAGVVGGDIADQDRFGQRTAVVEAGRAGGTGPASTASTNSL